jgi:predicted metal-dependent HD superfamily phosphohydrolase
VSSADPLRARWPLPEEAATRDELLAAYADPARGYHDLRHLTEVLDRLDELAAAGEPFEREPVVLAAWFHDAVYDGGPDDEERSARLAEDELAGEAADVPEVARLVRLTATHRPRPGDTRGELLCDADLAILAAPDDRYTAYVAGVRREYAALPDPLFARGRAAVLADLLAKPTLFHTPHALEHWEARARANLSRELDRLQG